jgi:hypothetical protein
MLSALVPRAALALTTLYWCLGRAGEFVWGVVTRGGAPFIFIKQIHVSLKVPLNHEDAQSTVVQSSASGLPSTFDIPSTMEWRDR